MSEKNKAIARRFYEEFAVQRKQSVLEEFAVLAAARDM